MENSLIIVHGRKIYVELMECHVKVYARDILWEHENMYELALRKMMSLSSTEQGRLSPILTIYDGLVSILMGTKSPYGFGI